MQILVALFTLFVSTSDAEVLAKLPGTKLTVESARQHIAAARIAGAIAEIDPNLILVISYHESRFELDAVGPTLSNNKRACGVMQHVPVARCPEPSMLRDYVDGAQHLATWIKAQRGDVGRGLIGYAGGYALLKKCDLGEAPKACSIARIHLARAARLKHARAKAGS
jgi:hypothetical protein